MTDRVRQLPRDEYLATIPRKRTAAGVLLRATDDRIVVIEPAYKDDFEIPGGVAESQESPRDAAERELKEEIGLVRQGMRPLVVDYVPDAADGVPEGEAWIFDGGFLTEEEERDLHGTAPEEVKSVQLCRIDDVVVRMRPWRARRIRLAYETVLRETAPVFSEEGRPWVYQVQPSGTYSRRQAYQR